MAAFQASRQLLHELALLQAALRDGEAPDCLREHAKGWQHEIAGLTDLLEANLFGPTVRLLGQPGVGKTSLLNALVGWPLLPCGGTGQRAPQLAGSQPLVELVSVPPSPQPQPQPQPQPPSEAAPTLAVSLHVMEPEEWLLRKVQLVSDACGAAGIEAQSQLAAEALTSMYGSGWLYWRQHAVCPERDAAVPAGAGTAARLPEDDAVVELLGRLSAEDVFGEHSLEQQGCLLTGRFNASEAEGRAAATQCLRRVLSGSSEGGPPTPRGVPGWFRHVVKRVTVRGVFGALPAPCTVLDGAGLLPTGQGKTEEEPQPARPASTYDWVVVTPESCPEEDAALADCLRQHLTSDGDLARLRVICTKCDAFDAERTAPQLMADIAAALEGRVLSLAAAEAHKLMLPGRAEPTGGLRVLACSPLAAAALAGAPTQPRQRHFLDAIGVSNAAGTGLPRVVAQLEAAVAGAQASLQPALRWYASVLSSMEAGLAQESRPAGSGDGDGADGMEPCELRRVFEAFEGSVAEETAKLEAALERAMREVLEPGIKASEQRAASCAREEILPQLRALQAPRRRPDGRHGRADAPWAALHGMAATLLGAVFPDAPFVRALMSQQGLDVAAELTAAYLGETAARPAAGGDVSELESEFALLDYEMDAVWGRVAGVSSNSRAREPGLLVQALRQLYSAVQAHLDELASAAADDISEMPALEVALVNQVHDVAHFRRQGLRRLVETASQVAVEGVILQQGGASESSGAMSAGSPSLADRLQALAAAPAELEAVTGRISDAVRNHWRCVSDTVMGGAQRQLDATLAGLRRQVLLRGVAALAAAPSSSAFLMPLLMSANAAGLSAAAELGSAPSEQGFSYNLDRLREISEYLAAVAPEEMKRSFHTGPPELAMCPICYAQPEEFRLTGCRCSVLYAVCGACVELPRRRHRALCPQCRAAFVDAVAVADGDGDMVPSGISRSEWDASLHCMGLGS